MSHMNSALSLGLTVSVSPASGKGIEVELQKGGYDNPRLFAGFRAILSGGKQRYIGLAENGKTTLPAGSAISGLHLADGAKLVRVTWDAYPATNFLFLLTPREQLIGIEPAAGIDINTAPQSLQVRGFFNLTSVVVEGQRFMKKLKGKAVPAMPSKEFRVLRYPKIEEGLRVIVPSLEFLSETTTKTADTLKEGRNRPPKPSSEIVATSAHALIRLPADTLGETVTPRACPKDWLTFAQLPSEDDAVVFMSSSIPANGSAPIYGVHHLRTLLAAASA